MMKKRIISCLCASALMMSFGAATAFAAEKTTTSPILGSPRASFDFTLSAGADSSQAFGTKNDTSPADVYPKGGNLPSGNEIWFRVHDDNGRPVSELAKRKDLGHFQLKYLTSTSGYEFLYASAPSTNKTSPVKVSGVWYP